MSKYKLQTAKNNLEQCLTLVEAYPDLHKSIITAFKKVSNELSSLDGQSEKELGKDSLAFVVQKIKEVSNRQKYLKSLLKMKSANNGSYQRELEVNKLELNKLEVKRLKLYKKERMAFKRALKKIRSKNS